MFTGMFYSLFCFFFSYLQNQSSKFDAVVCLNVNINQLLHIHRNMKITLFEFSRKHLNVLKSTQTSFFFPPDISFLLSSVIVLLIINRLFKF